MTELNLQQKAAAAKGQLGPSSLLAFWNTLSPVTSPAPRSQGKDFPTGLPPSRHCSFHRHAPPALTQYAAHGCISNPAPPPPLSTQINTLAYCHKIRRQIQCPKITWEKNDTPLLWLDSEWSPAPCPTTFVTVALDSRTEGTRRSHVQRVHLGTRDGLAVAL